MLYSTWEKNQNSKKFQDTPKVMSSPGISQKTPQCCTWLLATIPNNSKVMAVRMGKGRVEAEHWLTEDIEMLLITILTMTEHEKQQYSWITSQLGSECYSTRKFMTTPSPASRHKIWPSHHLQTDVRWWLFLALICNWFRKHLSASIQAY